MVNRLLFSGEKLPDQKLELKRIPRALNYWSATRYLLSTQRKGNPGARYTYLMADGNDRTGRAAGSEPVFFVIPDVTGHRQSAEVRHFQRPVRFDANRLKRQHKLPGMLS